MKNNTLKNKLGIRFISVMTAATLLASGIVGCGKASEEATEPADIVMGIQNNADEDLVQNVMEQQAGLINLSSGDTAKEEVVYVLADASGNTEQIIVSDWLKNGTSEDIIIDTTNLNNIENVSGDESYDIDENGNLVWNANGNDIHYQGTTDAELPVEVSVTYLLDGKDISPEEIAGMSGRVTIRFDYSNKVKKNVTIGDEEKEIYVPFTMMSGAILDNDHFSNIKVTNGRVVSTGSGNIVVGMAFPGLSESINVNKIKDDISDKVGHTEEIGVPEYVEITADAVDFQMNQTMTMAFSDILSSLNLDSEIDFDTSEITDSMGELSDASDKLADGSSSVCDGAGKLSDGARELSEKSVDLDNGAGELRDGAIKLDNGVESLKDGARRLSDGTVSLKSGADTLATGMQTLSNGAETLKSGVDSLKSGADSLCTGAELVSGGLGQVESAIASQEGSIDMLRQAAHSLNDVLANSSSEISTTSMRATVEASQSAAGFVIAAAGSSLEAAIEARNAIPEGEDTSAADAAVAAAQEVYNNAVDAYARASATLEAMGDLDRQITDTNVTEQVKVVAQGLSAGLDGVYGAMYGGDGSLSYSITALHAGAVQVSDGIRQVANGAGTLQSGASQLSDGISSARDGAVKLSDGAGELSAGAGTLYNGTIELKNGTEKLSSGTEVLKNGTHQFVDGTATLYDGTLTLSDGTKELMNGMIRFKEEGVDSLTGMFGDDVENVIDTINAVMEAGSDYRIFSDVEADTDSSVKFIYKTTAIK